jgi:hypothetical protein
MKPFRTFSLARSALFCALALATLGLASCGGGRNFPKVYPVKGKVLINGQPAADCQLQLHRTTEDLSVAVTPQAVTDKNGQFRITSFNTNDGAPEGEYVVTITRRERSGLMKQDFDGPDELGGAYEKIEKTKGLKGFVVQVGRQPLELPPFELTQSAEAKRRLEEAKKHKSFSGPLGSSEGSK